MLKQLVTSLATVALLGTCSTARAQDFPKGTFSTKLGEEKWSVTFDGKGKYIVRLKGEALVEGVYKATKDQIVFDKEKGKIASPGPGKYKWKLDGKKLAFTKIEDESEGRAKALTFGPWTMEETPCADGPAAALGDAGTRTSRRSVAHRQPARTLRWAGRHGLAIDDVELF